MHKFSALRYFQLASQLSTLKEIYKKDQARVLSTEVYTSAEGPFQKMMQNTIKLCEKIGLTVSIKCAGYILEEIKEGDKTAVDLSHFLDELERTIGWELQDKLFLHVPSQYSGSYDKSEMFGEKINTKLPELQFDATEAGNCLALGRGTACAFHLMRIMERVVQYYGSTLGIDLTDQKDWAVILDGINKALKPLPQKDPKTIAMCQAAGHLHSVKVAWRNPTMHPKSTYTLEEASDMMASVKAFMREFAEIL